MTNLLYILIALIMGSYLLIQLVNLYALFAYKKNIAGTEDQPVPDYNLPYVSVLLAARNEEVNIIRCLEALDHLDYPKDRIQILVGNDQSEDRTGALASEFITGKPQFQLVTLTGNEFPQTKGKARVLAALAHLAKGDIFLITDADIQVPATWARDLVLKVNDKTAIAAGTTWIESHTAFEHYQAVDWMYFMGMIGSFASIGIPLTSVGNNMAVTAKAYRATGGYETIRFSITEDYALYKAVRRLGYNTVNLMSAKSLVFSKPIETFAKLMNQRKRWLKGGWDLPLHWKIFLFIFGAYYIASIVLLCLNPTLWLYLFLFKFLLQNLQVAVIYKTLKQPLKDYLYLFTYDFYLMVIIPITSVWFFIPAKTVWKGRKY